MPLYPLPAFGSVFVCRGVQLPRPSSRSMITDVRRRVRLWRRAIVPLRFLSSILFVFVFVFCPVAIWLRGLSPMWPVLLVELVVIVAVTALEFRYLHHRLLPTRIEERRSKLVVMALSPLAAMRATDALTQRLLDDLHPVPVALALCDRDTAAVIVRRWLADSGIAEEVRWGERSVEGLSRDAQTADLLLRQGGLSLGAVLAPPPPENDGCRSYCPRCGAQYTLIRGTCGTCGGVALRSLGPGIQGNSRDFRGGV